MALSAQDKREMAELMASMLAAQQETAEPEPTTKEHTTARGTKATVKASSKVTERNLDFVEVPAGESLTFRVLAANASGPLTGGARVVPVVSTEKGERVYKSLDATMLVALQDEGIMGRLTKAIATVEKRALIGQHAPKVAA